MKSILTAGVLALGIHGLLFCLDFNWPGRPSLENPVPLVLNMTLTSITGKATARPALEKKEPVLKEQTMGQKHKNPVVKKRTMAEKKTKPVLKKPPTVKKHKQRPKLAKQKPLQKASAPKRDQIPLQSKADDALKAIAKHNEDTSANDVVSKIDGLKTVSKGIEHDGASLSPLETIHEAKPAYRSNPSPKYPRIARIRGFQGNVLLDVLVNADGTVEDIKIFKSSGHPVLDKAAKSTVKLWLFDPGRIGKRKVDMWVRVPIRFELME
ncbi:MAG: energy transducer TonB [Desulfobacterales bacterium]